MLTYDAFKKVAKREIESFKFDDFKIVSVKEDEIIKNNGVVKDALLFRLADNNNNLMNISPNVYLDDLYKNYKNTGYNLDEMFDNCREFIINGVNNSRNSDSIVGVVDKLKDNEYLRNNIYVQLVNTEANKKTLDIGPHKEIEDLSCIYRVLISNDNDGIASTRLSNELYNALDINAEDLHELALANTDRLFGFEVMTLGEKLFGDSEAMPVMYIISNKTGVSGAAVIANQDNLDKVCCEMNCNEIMVLPSSVHECLAVPTSLAPLDVLKDMVCSANEEVVDLNERLSNNVYHYDTTTRKLSLADDKVVSLIKEEKSLTKSR